MPIRRMAPADLGPVAEIEQESPSPWTPEFIAAELSFPGSMTLISEDLEGLALGWCCARIVDGEAELLKIAVHPQRRGTGIGSAMLVCLLDCLKGKGVGALFLEVRSKNLPALRLYRRYGFVQIGQRSSYYSNPADTAVIMKKEIVNFEN